DALDEHALAPVDHLVAEAQLQAGVADVERAVEVRVEQVNVVELLLVLETLVTQLGLWPQVLAGRRDRQARGARRRVGRAWRIAGNRDRAGARAVEVVRLV